MAERKRPGKGLSDPRRGLQDGEEPVTITLKRSEWLLLHDAARACAFADLEEVNAVLDWNAGATNALAHALQQLRHPAVLGGAR